MARLLIVDDHPPVATALAMLLRQHGHTSEIVSNGLDGLRLLAAEPPFDLMVLDNNMPPGMSGLDVLAEMANTRAKVWPPVIMFSASTASRYEALRLGAAAFVVKDDPDELILAIAQHVRP